MVALKPIGVFSTRSEVFFRHTIHSRTYLFFLVVNLLRTLQFQPAPDALARTIDRCWTLMEHSVALLSSYLIFFSEHWTLDSDYELFPCNRVLWPHRSLSL